MAWGQYTRGDKGYFTGSTGGGGGGGGRGGGGGSKGGGSKGGGSKKSTKVAMVSKSGKVSTYPAQVRLKGTTAAVTPQARVYLQQSGSSRRSVVVSQIKNGKMVAPKDSRLTRGAVGGRSGVRGTRVLGNTSTRVGTPIGNKNIRYVSTTHAAARSVTLPYSKHRATGRALSTGSRIGAQRSQTPLRSGYIVAYGPRVKG